jgi:hypothetical protein
MMPLNVGKAAGWIGGRTLNARGVGVGIVGTAAVAGGMSEIARSEGPMGDIAEYAMGDREAIRYSMKAGLVSAFNDDLDVEGPMDYYYGRPVNPNNVSIGRTTPVSGDIVLGSYNLRRGR